MSTRWVTCAVCLGCAAYLASEALPRTQLQTALPPAPPPASSGAAKPRDERSDSRAWDAALSQSSDTNARRYLDESIRRLRSLQWARLTIWQKQHGPDGFEAESHLLLGPEQCARLEMTVRAGDEQMHQFIISDGRALATIVRRPGIKDTVRGVALPDERGPREQMLRSRGCVGPAPLLKQLRNAVSTWRGERLTVQGREVWRLTAALNSEMAELPLAPGASRCQLDLEAVSLLPRRLEFREASRTLGGRLLLEMEFRDVEINRALSAAECAEVFSYQPR